MVAATPTKTEQAKQGLTPLSPESLVKHLKDEGLKRNIINKYIDDNLREGSDYDKAFPSAKHPSLLKAGSEKIISLLNLEAVFEADLNTLAMLSEDNKGKTVCYICHLTDRATGIKVAEGRGAYTMGEKNNDTSKNLNTAVKMAEKRAQIDATLRIAALSDRFTQDAPPVPSGQDQTDEVLDALRGCHTIKNYRAIAQYITEGKYVISEAARAKVNEFCKKTVARLTTMEDTACKCKKDVVCDSCKEDIKEKEKSEAGEKVALSAPKA